MDFLQELLNVHGHWLAWIGLVSALAMVVGLLSLHWLVRLIPEDYLLERVSGRPAITLTRVLVIILRNLLGAALLLIGVMLLVLPGQGVLTIVMALLIMDFPGKHRLVVSVLGSQHIFSAINRIRQSSGAEPLQERVQSSSD